MARLRFTSNADDATETVLLAGTSTNDANVGVGGTVPSVLSLTVPGSVSFGAFQPGLARAYDVSLAPNVTSTAGNAALTVTDVEQQRDGPSGERRRRARHGAGRAVAVGGRPEPGLGQPVRDRRHAARAA